MQRTTNLLITSLVFTIALASPVQAPAFVTIYADSVLGFVPQRAIGFIHGQDEVIIR